MTTGDEVLLKALEEGQIVTTRTAPEVLGLSDVRANIRNLRNKGIDVKGVWKTGINRYGNKTKYKEYFLESAKEKKANE